MVESSRDLEDAARGLVDAANAGGGEDNITVVLFQIDGDDTDPGETARMPAAAAPEPDEADDGDDEDTLSPLDAVPAVDTAVIPAAAVREHLSRLETAPAERREPRRPVAAARAPDPAPRRARRARGLGARPAEPPQPCHLGTASC